MSRSGDVGRGTRERGMMRAARLLVVAVLAALFVTAARLALRAETFGFGTEHGQLKRMMDFAWLLAFARAVWSGDLAGHGSVFAKAAFLEVTREWTGLAARHSFPFAYSPIMLWVLAPLCALPERWAYVVWILAGLGVSSALVLRAPVNWLGLFAFVTPVTVLILVTGQTSLLTTAGLYLLIRHGRGRPPHWGRSVVLLLLTAKLQLALSAYAALVARRELRTVAIAVVLVLLATAAVLPWLGSDWWRDYWGLIAGYDRQLFDPLFSTLAVRVDQMTNLRAALAVDLGVPDQVATRISGTAWLAGVAALVAAGLTRRMPACLAWPLSILAFLTLCPHVSPTEEIALFCVLVALGCEQTPAPLAAVMAALVVAGLWLAPALGPAEGLRPSPLLLVKVVLAGYLVAVHLPHRERADPPAPDA